VGGKATRRSLYSLRKWRAPAFFIFLLFYFMTIFMPLGVLAYVSLSRFITITSLTELTLMNWTKTLLDPLFQQSLINSLILAIVGGALTIALAAAVTYVSVRMRGRLTKEIEALSQLPFCYPSPVLGMAFIWVFAMTPIYRTLWILLLFYIVTMLPFAVRTLSPFMFQVHPELEEASWLSGVDRFRTFVQILLPLLIPAILHIYTMVFQLILREFGGSVLLAGPGTWVASVYLWLSAFERGDLSAGAVISIVLTFVSLAPRLVLLSLRKTPEYGLIV
jgi:iron(III) transport system permease protein